MSQYARVLDEDIWQTKRDLPVTAAPDRIQLAYQRARSLTLAMGLTIDDIVKLTPKFWDSHRDMVIVTRDTAVCTILTIHFNLCMGTIANYSQDRPDLQTLLDRLLRFEVCGEFMLTERGHGLDARNIETTATLNCEDGSFDLHTPSPSAAKTMPPSTSLANMSRVAVVFARLVIDGKMGSLRPFVVKINAESGAMMPGIESRLLPSRPGARELDHAVTTFNHVSLPPTALLGHLEEPESPREAFLHQVHRVSVGTLALSMGSIPALRLCAYIAGRYSLIRTVGTMPIISFATQYRPILTAMAQTAVFEAYSKEAAAQFVALQGCAALQHAVAAAFKITVMTATQATGNELIDRCGWQGLYAHNQMAELVLSFRGNTIAEGDMLVLCIRLATEVLLGRYTLPSARDPNGLLARHEAGVWDEMRKAVASISAGSSHRNDAFNAIVLPRARSLVIASGQRMAYEAAAADTAVSRDLLALYEATCVAEDASWYIEHAGMSREEIARVEREAFSALLPRIEELLEKDEAAKQCATAPILRADTWEEFVQQLPLSSKL